MSVARTLLIIDKSGTPKILAVKDYKEDEIYKKCGFKKPDGLEKRHTWVVRVDKTNYRVAVFAKDDGKANMENKYEFPPPIDSALYFGSCAVLVEQKNLAGVFIPTNLTITLWDKIYEKMFGGFDSTANKDDDDEIDELETVLKSKKTMNGYLKDGFVVDSENEEEEDDEYSDVDSDEGDDDVVAEPEPTIDVASEETEEEDVGSELSEESYTY